MGVSCSKHATGLDGSSGGGTDHAGGVLLHRHDPYAATGGIPDAEVYDFLRRSVALTQQPQSPAASSVPLNSTTHQSSPFRLLRNSNTNATSNTGGQFHLLYRQQQQLLLQSQQTSSTSGHNFSKSFLQSHLSKSTPPPLVPRHFPTRLVMRRHPVRTSAEEGVSGTHIYAVRWTDANPKQFRRTIHEPNHRPEQYPQSKKKKKPLIQSANASVTGTACPISDVTFTTYSGEDGFDIVTGTAPKDATADTCPLVGTSPVSSVATTNRRLEDRRITTTSDGVVVDDFSSSSSDSSCALSVDNLFRAAAMAAPPKRKVADWVTVSAEHSIYVADVGLSVAECNYIVSVTEQQCRGQYAAYTYAKQTLGCREYPALAVAVQGAVHTVVAAIMEQQEQLQQRYEYNDSSDSTTSSANKIQLVLDDREPHMVKYDVTKKERQKLDMHTDKSEWTFLIAVSNGAGVDYTGGGTYFECLDATVHVQRGHALIFPGKLRHCGQRITAGLRFLLVGFLVDKTPKPATVTTTNSTFLELDDMHKYACNIP